MDQQQKHTRQNDKILRATPMDERLPAAETLPSSPSLDRQLISQRQDAAHPTPQRQDAAHPYVAESTPSSPYLDRQSEILIATGDLPHWHQDGKLQFVTFRLADSLPQTKIAFLKEEIAKFTAKHPRPWNDEARQEYWKVIGPIENKLLDNGYGSCILKDPHIREIVSDAIFFHDGKNCDVVSFVIMPNHVHILMQLTGALTVMDIMHSIKSFTANKINKIMGKTGSVWKKEYFDRMIRSESHFRNCLEYIRENPKHLRKGEYMLYG